MQNPACPDCGGARFTPVPDSDFGAYHLARCAGYRVREIPFALVQDHETSINFATQAPRMLRDLVRIRLNNTFGRYR